MDDKLLNELLNQASQITQKKYFLLIGCVTIVIVALIAILFELRKGKLFKKYHLIASRKNILGADATMQMLKSFGFDNIKVRFKAGNESDKYDLKAATVYLSERVHNGASLVALYMAARQVNNVLFHANDQKLGRMLNVYDKIKLADIFVFTTITITTVILIFNLPLSAIAWILFAVASASSIASASMQIVKKVWEIKLSENSGKLLIDEQLIYDDEAEIVKRLIHEEKISDMIEMIFSVTLYLIVPIFCLLVIFL